MMYSAKIYARFLVDLIIGLKNPSDINDAIKKFSYILEKNGGIKKVKEIIMLAEKIYFQKTQKRKITLEISRKTDTKEIKKKILRQGDFLEEKINQDLIAGVKIVINNEKQLDFSFKNKLNKIFS